MREEGTDTGTSARTLVTELAASRLHSQRLSGPPCIGPADVVGWLTPAYGRRAGWTHHQWTKVWKAAHLHPARGARAQCPAPRPGGSAGRADTPVLPEPRASSGSVGSILSNVVTIGGRVRGSWRRTGAGKRVLIDVRPLAPLAPVEVDAVEGVADRMGRFLGRPVELRGTVRCQT